MKVGIIGLGKMGEAIVRGLRSSPSARKFQLQATSRSEETAEAGSKALKINCHTDNRKLVSGSDVVILCVKPHQAQSVLESIAGKLTKNHLLISICASITTEQLAKWSGGGGAVIR